MAWKFRTTNIIIFSLLTTFEQTLLKHKLQKLLTEILTYNKLLT